MFERFTKEARGAVVAAQRHARAADAREIDAEHLLLAIRGGGGYAEAFLAERLPGVDGLAAEFERVRRNGGLGPGDATALGELGIDVDQVVAAVEQVHGAGALALPAGRGRRGRHLPFSRTAKKTLEQSLRQAGTLGDRALGTEHILLALLAGHGLVADVLSAHGVEYLDLYGDLSRKRVG